MDPSWVLEEHSDRVVHPWGRHSRGEGLPQSLPGTPWARDLSNAATRKCYAKRQKPPLKGSLLLDLTPVKCARLGVSLGPETFVPAEGSGGDWGVGVDLWMVFFLE